MDTPTGGSGPLALHVSTREMPPLHRVAKWREEFARQFLHLDIVPHDPESFQADATIRALPGLKIGVCTISASDWRRTPAMVDPGTEEFGLMFGSAGPAVLSQNGRSFELAAGDAGTCSNAEPADLVLPCANGQHLGLVVPLKPLAALVGTADVMIAAPYTAGERGAPAAQGLCRRSDRQRRARQSGALPGGGHPRP